MIRQYFRDILNKIFILSHSTKRNDLNLELKILFVKDFTIQKFFCHTSPISKEGILKSYPILDIESVTIEEYNLSQVIKLCNDEVINYEEFHSFIYHQYMHLLSHIGKEDLHYIKSFKYDSSLTPEINAIVLQMKILLNHPEIFHG